MPAQQVLRIFFKLFPPLASAVQSDSVRRPIRFRSPPDQIPFAAQSDSVRRPIGFRSPSDDKIKQITLHFYGSFNANGCIAAVFSLYTSIETRRARRERTQGKSRK